MAGLLIGDVSFFLSLSLSLSFLVLVFCGCIANTHFALFCITGLHTGAFRVGWSSYNYALNVSSHQVHKLVHMDKQSAVHK